MASEKEADWRLGQLLISYGKQVEPIPLEDVTDLSRIAVGDYDLHAACRALEQGCTLTQALNLFT